jgi:sugar lactone lactonase YvrE
MGEYIMKKPWVKYVLWIVLLFANGVAVAQTIANTAIQTGELFISDARVPSIVRIDPSTGRKITVTTGGKLKLPGDLAFAPNDDLIVADSNAGLLRINPISGVQSYVIECPGYTCNAPSRIAAGPNGQLFGIGTVGGSAPGGVILVDPVTGAMTLVSSGGLLTGSLDLAVANNGDVYVLNANSIVRLRYNGTTHAWDQSLVSTGGLFRSPGGIAVGNNGYLYVADLTGKMFQVDPVSGAQKTIASSSSLINHYKLDIAPNGDIFVTGDIFQDASVVRLRFDSAAQVWRLKIITTTGQLQEPRGIVVARHPISNINLDAEKDTYVSSDLSTRENDNYGMQQFIALGTGQAPPFLPDATRALVQFDLTKVPLAQLQNATLALTIQGFDSRGATLTYQIDAHRILEGPFPTWIEGNGFAGSGGPPGSTDPDSAGGVAWSGAGDNPDPAALNNETQPRFDPLVVASKTVDQGTARVGDVVYLDVTSLVAAWLNGSAPNLGIMLVDPTSSGRFGIIRFGAREGKSFGLAGAVAGPRLIIHYKNGDINGDGSVDTRDIQLIMAALGQKAGPYDPRDLDGDGWITVLDARRVTLLCSKPQCAP